MTDLSDLVERAHKEAIIECTTCGGEGYFYEPESRFSRWHLDPPSEIAVPCPECHGRGLVSGEPTEQHLEDLRDRCGDSYDA